MSDIVEQLRQTHEDCHVFEGMNILLEAADEIERLYRSNKELKERYASVLKLLNRCYVAGHRKGWEDGESNSEVMRDVSDWLEGEKLEDDFTKLESDNE